MKISFARGAWQNEALVAANSYRWEDVPEFHQAEDCVFNQTTDRNTFGFENVSLMVKTPFTGNYRVSTECAFESFGAPLIVIAHDLARDARGLYRYREYYEVVIYEMGINVWRLTTDKNDTVTWKKMMNVEFPVAAGEKHTLTVDIKDDVLEIAADGKRMSVRLPDLPKEYYLGIDACENINRFYSFSISPLEDPSKSVFLCSVCGHRHTGDAPPEHCPDCGVGPEKYFCDSKQINE
ncbi:MAG: hypothetical protein E7609_01610 [Ruminococcaceae bacterium]|nr:hypothetical protein [Oscillospiraceae bacterium]